MQVKHLPVDNEKYFKLENGKTIEVVAHFPLGSVRYDDIMVVTCEPAVYENYFPMAQIARVISIREEDACHLLLINPSAVYNSYKAGGQLEAFEDCTVECFVDPKTFYETKCAILTDCPPSDHIFTYSRHPLNVGDAVLLVNDNDTSQKFLCRIVNTTVNNIANKYQISIVGYGTAEHLEY